MPGNRESTMPRLRSFLSVPFSARASGPCLIASDRVGAPWAATNPPLSYLRDALNRLERFGWPSGTEIVFESVGPDGRRST
jgi:hypothetical protein